MEDKAEIKERKARRVDGGDLGRVLRKSEGKRQKAEKGGEESGEEGEMAVEVVRRKGGPWIQYT